MKGAKLFFLCSRARSSAASTSPERFSGTQHPVSGSLIQKISFDVDAAPAAPPSAPEILAAIDEPRCLTSAPAAAAAACSAAAVATAERGIAILRCQRRGAGSAVWLSLPLARRGARCRETYINGRRREGRGSAR
uniref:Uncharacterized protein n=1 Tax=Leersia perrieri TaxID=77586 RepID=A0A0D9VH96_9ORYZ